MGTFEVSETIDAPVHKVWLKLADIGNINEWNPGVKDSYTTNTVTGVGATRHCDLGGSKFLEEQVVTYDPNRAITLRIIESNLPFQSADIRFTIESLTGVGFDGCGMTMTKVTCSPIYKLKYGMVGQFLDTIMVHKKYKSGMTNLLLGLKRDIETSKQ